MYHSLRSTALPRLSRRLSLLAALTLLAVPPLALMSQRIVTGDTATIFVGIASDRLAGRGMIYRLVRDASGRWAKVGEVQLWVS